MLPGSTAAEAGPSMSSMPTYKPASAPPPHVWRVIVTALVVVATLTAGLWLRTAHLDQAPLHADEAATGARVLADRLEQGRYVFDPRHYHGPLLTAATVPLATLRGETHWNDLTKTTLRAVPAAAGVLTLLLLVATAPTLRGGAVLAALFAATSPLLVVYSRVYLHEPLQGAAAVLLIVAALRYAAHTTARGARRWALVAGTAAGLMFSNKETAMITAAAWTAAGAALLLAAPRQTTPHPRPDRWTAARRHRTPAILAAAAGAATIIVFYSDFGRHPAGVVDFLRTYFVYETSPAHHKPAGYYAWLMLWPKLRGGFWWTEAAVLVPALYGLAASFRDPQGAAVRFLGLAALAEAAAYSLIAYKTPWLGLVVWLQVCLVAGYGGVRLLTARPVWVRGLAGAFLITAVTWQAQQAIRAAHRFPADDRNPYVYVPTAPGIEKLAPWLHTLTAASPAARAAPLAVVGEQYWPLPWYLRGFDQVGHWPQWPAAAAELPLVLVVPTPDTFNAPGPLDATHTALPRSLRTDTPVLVYIRHDLWDAYLAAEPSP